jgi:SPP1 gp7 family putative phage head morphogenesis protein
MADKAHIATDQILADMEAHLSAIYAEASKGIEEKAAAYFAQFERLDGQKRELLKAGKLTAEEYEAWRRGKMMYGKRWTALKEQIADQYANVNRTALAYINDQLPEVYTINYNASGAEIADNVKGYSFTMTDAHTVKNLATSDKTLLPYKYLDGVKDVRWNTQKVNSAVLQGILQGESIPKLARRLRTVTEMNRASAIRNARTTVTSAECKGRQDSYERAEADGIKLQREWIAAIDGRTRHAHVLLDGQLADVDKPFKSELGEIMYPGDPEAHPSNVYNCRCTIAARVIGFENKKANKDLTLGQINAIIKSPQDSGKLATPYSDNMLPDNVKSNLHRLKKAGDCIETEAVISFGEIALMSRQTGVEFASITIGSKNYILRGSATSTTLPAELFEELKKKKGVLNCHSHPFVGDTRPSVEDLNLCRMMPWQNQFYIVSPDNTYSIYTKGGIQETRILAKDLSGENLEFYKLLFGGGTDD